MPFEFGMRLRNPLGCNLGHLRHVGRWRTGSESQIGHAPRETIERQGGYVDLKISLSDFDLLRDFRQL